MSRQPQSSTLFPYTTLFRSRLARHFECGGELRDRGHHRVGPAGVDARALLAARFELALEQNRDAAVRSAGAVLGGDAERTDGLETLAEGQIARGAPPVEAVDGPTAEGLAEIHERRHTDAAGDEERGLVWGGHAPRAPERQEKRVALADGVVRHALGAL